MLAALLLTLALALAARSLQARPPDVTGPPDARETIDSVERAFGYQIGDLVTRKIVVRGAALAAARLALPEPRQINPWLTLHKISLQSGNDDEFIALIYQITGAASEVSLLELPVVELKKDDQTVARIDALPISVSPLLGKRPLQRTGLGELQADRLPAQADFQRLQLRLHGLSAAFVLLAGALLWRRWLHSRPGRRLPFAQARHALRHQPDSELAWREIHRAFNLTAGHSVFLEDLDRFFDQHPVFRPAAEPVESFFEHSREHFFARDSATSADQTPRLLKLATAMARLESRQ